MKIILISGKMRHGKDTVAQFIKEEIKGRVLIIHYADYLKFICKQYYGWNGEKDVNGRELLQRFASDIVRTQEPDFWVNTVCHFLHLTEGDWDYVLIPDVRFPNEIFIPKREFGFQNVISLRVDRVGFVPQEATEEQLSHISETALDNFQFDNYIFNTSDLNGLREKVRVFVESLTRN